MGTCGFWGLAKNEVEKRVFSPFDSYPSGLGKDVVFLVQNNYGNLEQVFEKIILVKNVNNLSQNEAQFIARKPDDFCVKTVDSKYFCESGMAADFSSYGWMEYGYIIDLTKNMLRLYKNGNTMVAELDLDVLKYRDVTKAFDSNST